MLFHLLRIPILIVVLILAGNLTNALADEVRFGDGNMLKGKLATFKDGSLVFTTDYAKKIKIPTDQVQFIRTDDNVTLELTTGSTLTGKLLTQEDGRTAILLDTLGETVPFKWEQVKTINKPKGKWNGNLFIGGTIQSGNVDRTSISGGGEAKRKWEHDRFSLRALHNYSEDNGAITSRNTYGAIKFDHFFNDRLYSTLSSEILKDEFQDLNLRAIVGVGAGYRFWNNDVRTLEFEAGLSYFSEDRRAGQDEQFATARMGSNFEWHLLDNLTFKDYLLYYPNLEAFKEYRLRNEASLITALTEGWALKLTHIFSQNSNPSPGVEDKDQQFIFSLQYSF